MLNSIRSRYRYISSYQRGDLRYISSYQRGDLRYWNLVFGGGSYICPASVAADRVQHPGLVTIVTLLFTRETASANSPVI